MNDPQTYDFPQKKFSATSLSMEDTLKPLSDLTEYVQKYAHQRPAVVGAVFFGIGFVLGWKLRALVAR